MYMFNLCRRSLWSNVLKAFDKSKDANWEMICTYGIRHNIYEFQICQFSGVFLTSVGGHYDGKYNPVSILHSSPTC